MDGSDQGRPPPESAPRSASIQRTQGLWFDDANNVIQAGNHQFRVHRGILCARSPVLSNLFSDPTQGGIRRVEGCPVLRLSDDGEDVKNLLLAIYDPAFFEPSPKDVPVEIVLSVGRLSHKYEIQHLRHRAILHMERNYPPDNDAFILRTHGKGASTLSAGDHAWFSSLETTLDIIITAITINALWVLPAIYYWSANSTRAHILRASPSWNNPKKIPVLRDILTGKIHLEIMDMAYIDFLSTPPCSGCLNLERCALNKLSIVHGLPLSLASADWKLHTLVAWSDKKGLKEKDCKELCAPCASACISAYELARGNYWDKLPSAFNLPSWEELKLLRKADLGN